MKKTAILIDSTFTAAQNFLDRKDIFIVPLTINFENVSFTEQGDLNNIMEEIIDKVDREKVIPKTSQPSAQDFIDCYEEMIAAGYERIYAFHISGKLSGTVQGSLVAAEMVKDKHEKIEIEVFDTVNASVVAVLAVMEVAKYIDQEKELQRNQIEEILTYYHEGAVTLLAVDNLDYLALGGRIKPAIAALGNLFGVKPLLQIKDGEILEFTKVRTNKKAYKKMLELFEEDIKMNPGAEYYYGVTHVVAEKQARKLLTAMEHLIGARGEVSELLPLSPVIGNHTGPGAIAIFYIKKKNFNF